MMEVQQRMMNFLEVLDRRVLEKVVPAISHCHTIRTAIAEVLGLSLDGIMRFTIPPASVSRVQVGACAWGARHEALNEVRA